MAFQNYRIFFMAYSKFFYGQKPPLDEGVYIYNLAQGNSVTLEVPLKI